MFKYLTRSNPKSFWYGNSNTIHELGQDIVSVRNCLGAHPMKEQTFSRLNGCPLNTIFINYDYLLDSFVPGLAGLKNDSEDEDALSA